MQVKDKDERGGNTEKTPRYLFVLMNVINAKLY